jgi:hypothetical protein
VKNVSLGSRILYTTTDSSTEQTNKHNKEQAENTQTAQEQNTNGKRAECDHVKKRQQSSILKHMKINI